MNIAEILNNPIAKSLLLKKLEKAWKENNLTLITITKTGKDFEFETYTDEMTVIKTQDLNNIITG